MELAGTILSSDALEVEPEAVATLARTSTPTGRLGVPELDIHTVPDLTAALERCTDEHRVVIVDVSDLTFVDSTGLKVLVSARNRARDRFLLAGTSPALERLLELTGTGGLFRRSPS